MTPTTLSPTTQVHAETLSALRQALGETIIAELEACTKRLEAALSQIGTLAGCAVLAMFGGGKDSSFMTAVARYMQLSIEEHYGETFLLRIATNRHTGMSPAVLKNIDRVYQALALYGDPSVELLMIDGDSIAPFSPTNAYSTVSLERDRSDVLMNGHRCQGDPRPTFCNRCNLSMENALALAIGCGKQADVVLTGDSPTEQRHYLAWVRSVSRKMGNLPTPGQPSLHTFLLDLEQINHRLNTDVYGPAAEELEVRRLAVNAVRGEPLFFSVYEDTAYSAVDHLSFLTGFLGFEFDEIAFSFTESDCGNPGLMAHFNGLRHERLLGGTYAEGIREYATFAIGLMRRKEFPESLIEMISARYATPSGIEQMRYLMNRYASDAFNLDEDQLICMLYSPFAEGAKFLHSYLERERPGLISFEAAIRQALAHQLDPAETQGIASILNKMSGLDLAHLQRLFQVSIVPTRQLGVSGRDPISIILTGDPHKGIVERRAGNGEVVREAISGR